MSKYIYAIIAFGAFAGPFALSFDSRVHFIQYIPAVALATLSIGSLFIIWDILVTRAGHWQFNDKTVGSFRFCHLPLGEWLFFLLIPYASLFIYEVIAAYFGLGRAQPSMTWLQYLLFAGFALTAYIMRKKAYTALALLSSGLYCLISALLTPGIIAAPGYLLSIGLIFTAFVVVNGLYTSIPTIFYNQQAVTGIRIGSIPIEDFFYNLGYIGLTLTVYIRFKLLFEL